MSLKVISYNIQEGGGGRLLAIAEVLRGQEPDAAALLEASDRAKVEALGRELGMQVTFGEANNPVGHIAWLTRQPVRRAANHRHPGLSKTLLEIELSWNDAPLRLFATHLASRWDPTVPADEIPIILELLAPLTGRPHLLVGDLNALGPDDPVGSPPNGVEKRGEAVDGAPRDAIRQLVEAGYIDCYRSLHPESPGYTYPSDHPWLRLDYIFVSASLASALVECDVLQAGLASDHLPVCVRFR